MHISDSISQDTASISEIRNGQDTYKHIDYTISIMQLAFILAVSYHINMYLKLHRFMALQNLLFYNYSNYL